jgi:signal peptidase II
MAVIKFFWLKFSFAFIILVLFDQVFKNAVLAFLSSRPISEGGFISLEVYKNYGIVFGIPFPNELIYFAILIFLFLLFAGRFFDSRRTDKYQAIGLILLLAGAAGNLIDRLRWGYIIDFVSVKGIFVFNLADVFIAIGAILILKKLLVANIGKGAKVDISES